MLNLQESATQIAAPMGRHYETILTPDALEFLGSLAREFEPRRRELLAVRLHRQADLDIGYMPDFLPETEAIRSSGWKVASIPRDLLDRRVGITGPVDRQTIINALNSGASAFMADFEDANSPTWRNNIEGQMNLRDAVNRVISLTSPQGKPYGLKPETATLMVRPRGWHLTEKHFLVEGNPISAGLFDFGLFFFHNTRALMGQGTAPYFYLPKLEHYLEARLWNDVFRFAQDYLNLPYGTIRATVLIETLPAAFQMHEILYELREHSAGLNCGRWDYIFSFIKKFRNHPDFVLPDRGEVTMDRHFLDSYVQLLIDTCHRRGIHAMGGMAAQIPVKSDPRANEAAFEKVRQDKLREVRAGHDGTWVAHPGLVPVAREIFDAHLKGPHQIGRRPGLSVDLNLLHVPGGNITEGGLRLNIEVGLQYLESWLRGSGCVPIYDLREDAATAEICRTQVWQWVKHGARMNDGRTVTAELVRRVTAETTGRLRGWIDGPALELAVRIFEQMMTSEEFPEFLTLAAYPYID